MPPLLAIDPGASGGLAWRDAYGIVHAEPMPDGMTAQVDRLRSLAAILPGLSAIMEQDDVVFGSVLFATGCS